MRRAGLLIVAISAIWALIFSTMGLSQTQSDEEEKSRFVTYIENQISTDDFKIGLNGLEGTLSSNVSLSSITLADRKGVWLTIHQPQLVWSRSALLRGKIDVESLTASKIDFLRMPESKEITRPAEATPFSLPELPVAILVDKLEVAEINFAEPVFGLRSRASVGGALKLEDGSLTTDLSVVRLDGPGGVLRSKIDYSSEDERAEINLELSEPENGITANLLNLKGRPPVRLTVKGDGPVSDLTVDLDFDVDERRIMSGGLQISSSGNTRLIATDLQGPLGDILPDAYRDFMGSNSQLSIRAKLSEGGETLIEELKLKSGVLHFNATASLLADGFLDRLVADFDVEPNGSDRVRLPLENGQTSVAGAKLSIDYDAKKKGDWSAKLSVLDVKEPSFNVGSVELVANGNVTNFDNPAARSVQFNLEGEASNVRFVDIGLKAAMGDAIRLSGRGNWQSNQPLNLQDFSLSNDITTITANGSVEESVFGGNIGIVFSKLDAFSLLLGEAISGQGQLEAQGKIAPVSGGFDLKLTGDTQNLRFQRSDLTALFSEATNFRGGVKRDEEGLHFTTLKLSSAHMNAVLDGQYSKKRTNLTINALINEISRLNPNAQGTVDFKAMAKGSSELGLTAQLNAKRLTLKNRQTRNLSLRFDGQYALENLKGDLIGNGQISGKPIELRGFLNVGPQKASLSDIIAKIGATRLNGNLERNTNSLIQSAINIESTDITDAAALALIEASGAVTGSIQLFPVETMQALKANLKLSDFRYEKYRVGSSQLNATVVDVFGQPKTGATIAARRLDVDGTAIRKLDAKIGTSGDLTEFDLNTQLPQYDTNITSKGTVRQTSSKIELLFSSASLRSSITSAELVSPAKLTVQDGQVQIPALSLKVGSGLINLSGTAGNKLNLTARLNQFPLTIINAVQPQMRSGGRLSGRFKIGGSSSSPQITFNTNMQNVTLAALADNGIEPVTGSASGSFQDQAVILQGISLTNSQEIELSARGRIPLSGSGLNVTAEGKAPLNFASRFVRDRGARLSGGARFNMQVTGRTSSPNLSGLLSIENGSFSDPLSNLRLINIGLLAGLNGDRLTIRQGQADLSSGGKLQISGGVALTNNYPADIKLALSNARYSDAQTFSTTANGQLTLTGPLLQDPVLGGTINLQETQISIPENFASGSDLLDVVHKNPDAKTQKTLNRLKKVAPKRRPTSRPSILRLNLRINALSRIFVRGRGLDAELGGQVTVVGPVSNVQPSGGFNLRRGRLSILGQRIDLTEGTITLTGDLDPLIDMTATTRSGDVDAYITLSGRASDIQISFSSSPELPEEEVLAQIIFGRDLGSLSPAQLVKLASIAAELTGGQSPGLIDSIRKGTGLDDIDIVQDEDENTAVKVGKYINDNVYLGVQAGKKTEATINLDITDNIKARGTVSSEGDTGLGIFLEKDY